LSSKVSQYIIAPANGFIGFENAEKSFLSQLQHTMSAANRTMAIVAPGRTAKISLRILDSIGEHKPKLVECAPEDLPALRASNPTVRIIPVVYFQPAVIRHQIEQKAAGAAAEAAARLASISVNVVAQGTNEPVPDVMVVAFTDFANKRGAQGTTDNQGKASLDFGGAGTKIERLYLYPKDSFWPGLVMNPTLKENSTFTLDVIDLSLIDCVRFFYPGSELTHGAGMKVGVIDSGIATNHPDLTVQGGQNTVTGEQASDFGDNGTEGHGTHVAGIIAAHGAPPSGVRGVAPGVTLRSYRVFAQGGADASNFAIAKAIDAAVADGCDLINMSLGGGDPDSLTADALAAAQAAGVVVFAATGNDDRQSVSFPASNSLCQAVSAMGRIGTFPARSEPNGSIAAPFGADDKNFLASFSNVGEETDFVGPGVGVISTVPTGHGVMSGTSMATPAETGAAARLLAAQTAILSMPRNQARAAAMIAAIAAATKALGFGPLNEGKGMIEV
jgi:subtilisin